MGVLLGLGWCALFYSMLLNIIACVAWMENNEEFAQEAFISGMGLAFFASAFLGWAYLS